MSKPSTLEHVGSTIGHLTQEWESRRKEAALQKHLSPQTSHAYTIALSREAGTLGTKLAHEVGKRLGWQVYDHELLELIAREMGVRTSLLESVDERQQSWLEESVEAFVAGPGKNAKQSWVSETAFVRHLVETIVALGIHGECIIVGRGAPFILPSETTLRVRLIAPLQWRIEALSDKLGISEKEAANKVRTLDRERADFVQDHFQKDPTDLYQFDLILNVARMSVEAQAELVVEALHQRQQAAP